MTRLPRFATPSAIPEYTIIPAVSCLVAGGFICHAAPVVAFGTAKRSDAYILLSREDRSRISDVLKVEDLHDRIPDDRDRYAFLRANGDRGSWRNGENLWIAVAWLQWARSQFSDTPLTIGARAVFALVESL